MKTIDILAALLPVILIVIALLLACAVAIALTRNAGIVRRGAASCSSLSAVADDPFFFPFGEMPVVPRERSLLPLIPGERVSLEYGRGGRKRDASDFRAWGIPDQQFRGALRRNESGGRPASLSGTAVVLTFPKRGA